MERHQGGAVRQRHGGAIDHAAIAPLQSVFDRHAIVERSDDGPQRLPGRMIAVQRPAQRRDRLDVRPLGQGLGRQVPHAGEGGIRQADAAVAGKHGNAFGEIIERLALDADQLLETALEIEPLGHVVEQVGHAAVRIGRGDDAQRASVRQMPGVLLGLQRPIGGVQLRLPLPEVLLLGELARGAQGLEHRRISRLLIEIGGVQIPQRTVSGVVENQFLIGVEHRHARRQLIERAAVRINEPRQRAAHRLRFGRVDAQSGAAGLGAEVEHVEAAAGAGNDGRKTPGIPAGLGARPRDSFARRTVEELQVPRDRVGGVARFDGARVRGVDEGQPAGRVSRPDRRRQLLDQRAQRSDLCQQRFVTTGEVEQIAFDAACILEPQHCPPGDGAALRLDRTAAERRERHRKRLAAAPQRLDRLLHRGRSHRIEPAAEREHAMRRRSADDGGVALDGRLVGRRRPIDHHLRFG